MRFIKAFAVVALVACLAGCAKTPDSDNNNRSDIWDSEGYFLPCTNGAYLIVSDTIGAATLTLAKDVNIDFSDLTVGDKIRIKHGVILESYPAQTDIYGIEKLADGELSDIPQDALSNLEQLGWLPESE